MKYKNIRLNILILALFLSNSVLAKTSGDSVMMPRNTFSMAKIVSSSSTSKVENKYKYIYEIEEKLTNCPSGFKGSKGSQYISAQRNITKVYSSNQLINSIEGAWQNTDEECAKTETQSLSCGSGYTGSIQQERTVSSNGSASVWNDVSNTCVAIPPPPPPQEPVTPQEPLPNPDDDFNCHTEVWTTIDSVRDGAACTKQTTLVCSDAPPVVVFVDYGNYFAPECIVY